MAKGFCESMTDDVFEEKLEGGIKSQVDSNTTRITSWEKGIVYPTGTNLNTLTTTNRYGVWTDASALASLNFPVSEGGILTVELFQGDGENNPHYVRQIYNTRNGNHMYVRMYDMNTSTWSSWHTLY